MSQELIYAKPFADSLVSDLAFRSWVLRMTKFSSYADEARLLDEEMLKKRSPKTRYWWQYHFHTKCDCFGCRGKKESRETDILAVFEAATGQRFALHVEVKHPGDRFSEEQAEAYPIRAKCWATPGKTPERVLAHTDATTLLLFSETKYEEFKPRILHFDVPLTFERIKSNFPNATP